MKRCIALAFAAVSISSAAFAIPLTITHNFNGTKFGINPGGQPIASLLTTVIQADTSPLTRIGEEFVPLDSIFFNFTPLVPGELLCTDCTISAADRNAHYRVRFVDGVYQGYEMFGPILAGSGRVLLLTSSLSGTGFAVGGGFARSGLGVADRQTIIFSGFTFRTKYGPTSFSISQPGSSAPEPGTMALFGCGLLGLVAFRGRSGPKASSIQSEGIRSG